MSSLHDLIQQFVDQLSEAVEGEARTRARQAVERALGSHVFSTGAARAGLLKHLNGSNGTSNGFSALGKKPRKKPPIQLCPVPGCTERAAPIFGMVCAKH